MSTFSQLQKSYDALFSVLSLQLAPVILLVFRLYVAWVFFKSGLTKIQTWDSTLYLFELEYQVPVLPWEVAAYLGTGAELLLPILIAVGVMTRFMSLLLFGFNIIAVYSYPVLWEGGFYDHKFWGVMILANVLWGAGYLAIENRWAKPQ
jgi:putative oxidoreductase